MTINASYVHATIQAIDLGTNHRLAQAKKKNLGARAEEVALAEADEAKRVLRNTIISFDTAIPTTCEAARRPEHGHQLIRLRGTPVQMAEPYQVELPPGEEPSLADLLGQRPNEVDAPMIKALASKITIAGNGETVTTEVFTDRQLVNSFQDLASEYATWEFLLFAMATSAVNEDELVAVEGGRPARFTFYLVDARPLKSAIQVVAPTPGELEAAMKMYGNSPDVIGTAVQDLITYLEMTDTDRLPILVEAIRVQVLAAATEGQRCHTTLIGPPGVGKSLVAKAAKLVQPVFKFALPTKATDAGLVGDGHSSKKMRRPGLIPLAHTGCFSVEDFNQANSVKNQRFISVFTHTMAEGRISDASAAKVEYAAEVSILLDANRKSDVRRTGSTKEGFDRAVADLGIPMNVLSRMTYIAEIPRDAATQLSVAASIIVNKGLLTVMDRNVLRERISLLRVYLAAMRERYRVVVIPPAVRAHVQELVMAVVNTTQARFEQHPEFADFLTRLGGQALMLVQAHARCRNRGEAELCDVDAVFPLLWRKIDWVKTTLFGGQAEAAVVSANAKARRHLIRLRLNMLGMPKCTAAEMKRRIGLHSASLATIAEDLRSLLGDPDEEGVFQVVLKEPSCA
jgi:hypothetical protein